MQILFALSFGLCVAASLFIGNAMSEGYSPYASFVAAVLFLASLFLPFLSEYHSLNSGFHRIRSNFSKLMGHGDDTAQQGDVEIIMPHQNRAPAESYNFDKQGGGKLAMILLVSFASLVFMFDLVNFYILGTGLEDPNTPISNF